MPKIQKCKHPCIGLCGEECPRLCRICDKEKVEEIFFGSEDEEGARFLQLLDCSHVLEVRGMDTWMCTKAEGNDTQISLKACQKCMVPIIRSQRYGNLIKEIMNDVNEVKKKIFEERQDRSQFDKPVLIGRGMQETVSTHGLGKCVNLLDDIQNSLCGKVAKLNDSDRFPLEMINENQVNLLQRLAKLVGDVNHTLNGSALSDEAVGELTSLMSTGAQFIRSLMNDRISDQRVSEMDLEIKRLFLMHITLRTLFSGVPEDSMVSLRNILDLIRCGKKIERDEICDMSLLVEEVRRSNQMQPLSGDEREMVIKAMNFRKGHWYSCPNGHVYAIGECGGAMETSKCPDCKATIGGAQHQLASGNIHAGNFDGS